MPKFLQMFGYEFEDQRSKKYSPIDIDWCGDKILDGYWQSEKYFYDWREQIVADFKLKNDTWVSEDAMAREICETPESVFLHVRSYADIPSRRDYSAALPIGYYENAIQLFRSRCPNAKKMFVFSDDIRWARCRIQSIIEANGMVMRSSGLNEPTTQLRDFTLMRLCRHGIVANSSFSWWGGWLGEMESPSNCIRIRPDIRCMNDDYWPERWIAVRW